MKTMISVLMLGTVLILFGCNSRADETKSKKEATDKAPEIKKAKVTFIELGSVKCIPCKAMQPVMKAIEEEFGDQIKIVFYDVWKDNAPARKYGIRVIPTQVFLDEKGIEFHRHEGFYPKEEIEKILKTKGLKKSASSSAKKRKTHD